MRIALLAYGSLQWNPEEQLEEALEFSAATPTTTPFSAEFARSSNGRAGAPTLVPVNGGGARVPALLIPFEEGVSADEAKTLIWRRETGRRAGDYPNPSVIRRNTTVVDELTEEFADFARVLYVRFLPDMPAMEPAKLAELAIRSARGEVGAARRDGISYLSKAKEYGVVTPLSSPYESEILSRLSVASLDDAWEKAQGLL